MKCRRLNYSKGISTRYLSSLSWNHYNVGIAHAHTPPSAWYTESSFFRQVESEQTFRKHWICVGRQDQLEKEGSYIAGSVIHEQFIVVNNGDHHGKLRAFSNVCRHHAALICDGREGNLNATPSSTYPHGGYRMTCPYHGWEYNSLSGKLAKAIHMKGCKDFHANKIKLDEFLVDTVGPWIFIKLDGSCQGSLLEDQPDVAHYINMLQERDNDRDLIHIKHHRYHVKCNWKVFIDNYLDGGYHVPVAHPELSDALDMSTYTRERSQNFFVQTCMSRSSEESSTNRVHHSSNDKKMNPALYIFHYPNLCINRYGDWMDTNLVWPGETEHECFVDFDWYLHKSKVRDREYVEASLIESHRVQLEDIALSERVHRGLRSRGYDSGRYAPELEDGEYFFHQRLYEDYLNATKSEEISLRI